MFPETKLSENTVVLVALGYNLAFNNLHTYYPGWWFLIYRIETLPYSACFPKCLNQLDLLNSGLCLGFKNFSRSLSLLV